MAVVIKNPPANVGDMRRGFHSWVGKSPRRGNGNPLQYLCLENPMDCSPWGRKESDITEVTWHAHTTYLRASLGAQSVKNPPAMQETSRNAIDQGSIPGLERCPGGGHSNPLQYSCLENPMDRGAWWATVHRVAKSRT